MGCPLIRNTATRRFTVIPSRVVVMLVGLLTPAVQPLHAADARIEAAIKALGSGDERAQLQAAQTLGDFGPVSLSAVPQLTKRLSTGSLAVRHEVIIAIGRIGPAASEAVPSLIRLLSDDSKILRHGAIQALGTIGLDAKAALPNLQSLLSSQDLLLSVPAAGAIVRIAADDRTAIEGAIPVLIRGLKDENAEVRNEAITGLGLVGEPALPAVQRVLSGENVTHWGYACEALAAMGSSGKGAIPKLLELLHVTNVGLRQHTLHALGSIGASPEKCVPAIARLLADDSPAVRRQAAMSVAQFGPAAAPAVEALIGLLKDKDDTVRIAAAETLGRIGPSAGAAIPALSKALADPVGAVTLSAADALGRMGSPAIPVLIQKLRDPGLRPLIAHVLGEMGENAAEATPTLVEFINDKNIATQRAVLLSLAGIGPKANLAVVPLLELLNKQGHPARAGAAYALTKIGATDAIPVLKKTTNVEGDPLLSMVSAWALVTFDPKNEEYVSAAMPKLIDALGGERPLARLESARTLALIGPRAASAVPALMKAAQSDDPELRIEALSALAEIGPASSEAIPVLLKTHEDPYDPVRQVTTYALGKIGAASKPAVPALRLQLQGKSEFDRTLAAWALVRIAPDAEIVKAAIPLMIKAISRENPQARREAAETLGLIGKGNAEVKAALQKASDDTDSSVRAAAEVALAKLK